MRACDQYKWAVILFVGYFSCFFTLGKDMLNVLNKPFYYINDFIGLYIVKGAYCLTL